jgi:RNA polymerase sigma-70 factor (ECF subfamily)
MVMNDDVSVATGPVTPEVLGQLFDRHAAALELYARQWCDSPEDAVQEALIQLAAEPGMPRDVLAWLYRVVRNRALNAARSARRRRHHETQVGSAEVFTPSPGDAVDARVAAEALDELPGEEREVVVAHLWGGLTFQEIGHLTGTSDTTAHRRFVAALTALRERLRLPCRKNEPTRS